MQKFFWPLMVALIIIISCNRYDNNKEDVVTVDADTATPSKPSPSQVDIFYGHGDSETYIADFDTAVIEKFGGREMKAIAWSGPMKISEEGETYLLEGIADVVNFDIDSNCSSKFFRFKIPIDSVMPYLESRRYSDTYFFSWNTIFDTTGKRFVVEEIWQRGEHDKVVAELKDFNIHYGSDSLDSIQFLRFFTHDVFDKEFEIEAWVVNNSEHTIDKALVDMTLVEYDEHQSDVALDSVKYEELNLLPEPIPARTFQIVRKTFKNKKYQPSTEIKLRYYDTKQTLTGYQTKGEKVTVGKKIR